MKPVNVPDRIYELLALASVIVECKQAADYVSIHSLKRSLFEEIHQWMNGAEATSQEPPTPKL